MHRLIFVVVSFVSAATPGLAEDKKVDRKDAREAKSSFLPIWIDMAMKHDVVFQGKPEKDPVPLETGQPLNGKWYLVVFDYRPQDAYRGVDGVADVGGKVKVLMFTASTLPLDPSKIYLVMGRKEKVPEPFQGMAGGEDVIIEEALETMEDVGDELLDMFIASQKTP